MQSPAGNRHDHRRTLRTHRALDSRTRRRTPQGPRGIQALWRDTQRKFDALGALTLRFAEESRAEDERLQALIERFAQESRDADERLRLRIEEVDHSLQARMDTLVSGFGEFIAKTAQQQRPEGRQ